MIVLPDVLGNIGDPPFLAFEMWRLSPFFSRLCFEDVFFLQKLVLEDHWCWKTIVLLEGIWTCKTAIRSENGSASGMLNKLLTQCYDLKFLI